LSDFPVGVFGGEIDQLVDLHFGERDAALLRWGFTAKPFKLRR
jgi:hypothetical protein